MIKFRDGPAAGVTLMLRRTPLLLRVVRDERGEWDALDQLDDVPKPTESIVVYHADPSTFSRYHVCARGKGRSASGFYMMGEYVVLPEQPPDECLRTNEAWAEWAEAFRKEPFGFQTEGREGNEGE